MWPLDASQSRGEQELWEAAVSVTGVLLHREVLSVSGRTAK